MPWIGVEFFAHSVLSSSDWCTSLLKLSLKPWDVKCRRQRRWRWASKMPKRSSSSSRRPECQNELEEQNVSSPPVIRWGRVKMLLYSEWKNNKSRDFKFFTLIHYVFMILHVLACPFSFPSSSHFFLVFVSTCLCHSFSHFLPLAMPHHNNMLKNCWCICETKRHWLYTQNDHIECRRLSSTRLPSEPVQGYMHLVNQSL